jgi:hypothetical protein
MKNAGRFACLVMLALTASAALGGTITIPAGSGTLSFTENTIYPGCVNKMGQDTTYDQYNYSNFSYSVGGVNTPLTGTDQALFSVVGGSCPAPKLPPVTFITTTAEIVFTPTDLGSGTATVTPITTASGYVNPKYIVLGVTYAPPGSQSFVQYADSTTLGTNTSLTESFAKGVSVMIKVSSTLGAGGTIPNIGGKWGVSDTTTGTDSNTFTDETDNSSGVAITSTQQWLTKVPGPASPYIGVDHDYDVIWLWLNPLVNITITQIGSQPPTTTWTGYSYDADDVPEMDIYGVYLGWLTGTLSTPGPGTSDFTPLERTWAASNGQDWPAGTSPSIIDPTDYAAIAAADPFSNPNYSVSVPNTPAGNQTSSDGRFTLTGNQVVDYVQPSPGGQPYTQALTESTTKTQTQGEGAKYTDVVATSVENIFKGSFLFDSWSVDVTSTTTLTFTDQWSQTNTSSTQVSATGSVTGPPCVVSSGACSPVYTGPTEFEVFQDNIYNTFMFYPVN